MNHKFDGELLNDIPILDILLVKEKCNDVWESALQTASKQDVYTYVNQDKVFCASRFFRGKEYTHGLAYLTKDPSYENHVYCYDLTVDPDYIFDLDL